MSVRVDGRPPFYRRSADPDEPRGFLLVGTSARAMQAVSKPRPTFASPPDHAAWIAEDKPICGNISCDHCPCPYECVRADRQPAHNDDTGTHTSRNLDKRRKQLVARAL